MVKTALNPQQPSRILPIMELLFSKPEFISIAYSCLDGGREYDLFAHALLEFAEDKGKTLAVLRNVLLSEFQANVGTPTAIMRGNSATSRIMGIYCRTEGAGFLQKLLTDIVKTVVKDDVNFEIQREMLSSDEEHDANLKALLQCAEYVLKTITSPDAVAMMPRSIKALASFIEEFAAEFSEENKQALVGGFVMLRLINPCILAPDSYGICDCTPDMKGRRNLILLCKIIQGISNKRLFNEEWMLDCNSFMEAHMNDLDDFFKQVVKDEQPVEGQKPFADLLQSEVCEQNAYALSFNSYEFINWMLLEYKEALLEGLEGYLARKGITPETLQLVELVNDYEELPLDTSKMELFISGLCPYSRAVWLFCLANKLDITYHKLDLFTHDHGVDMLYKKFEKLSQLKQVPVLVDGEMVIHESCAIVAYLCNKFLLPSNWFPKAPMQAEMLVYQYLEWTQVNFQIPLARLWKEVQHPKSDGSNLRLENFPDLVTAVAQLDEMYPNAGRMLQDIKRGAKAPAEVEKENNVLTTKYMFGESASFVDTIVVTMLSFAQVLQGFTVSSYKNLTRVVQNFLSDHKKDWMTINHEFEGLINYIITVTTTNSMPKVNASFCFQQIPSTVFELLLDPENDIFLVLASKTISNKGNAKVKQGLKKTLDSSGGADGSGDDVPYVVSLDIGGNFNVLGREGTNLLLVAGSKILQKSRMRHWESGIYSTELFDIKPHASGHSIMELTQLNFPIDSQKELEDMWVNMWKKLNGTRVGTVSQLVYFKGKSPSQAYISLSDWRVFSKMTKSKIKEEAGGWLSLFSGKVSVKVEKLQPHAYIKQTWRSSDWIDDHVANLSLDIEPFDTNSSRVRLTMDCVPFDKIVSTAAFWKTSVWKKFGAVLVEDIEQTVYFPQPVDDVYRMWLDESTMSSRLKTKCNIEKGVGGIFSPYGIKCIFTQLSKNKSICFTYAQKDWPTGHQSMVELAFEAINLGPDTETTQLTLKHQNVPSKFVAVTYDSWMTDFWVKLSAVQTKDISGSVILRSIGPEALYYTLLNSSKLSGLTASSCSIIPEMGTNYHMYNKSIKGQVVELVPFSKIVLSMRDFEWPYSHLSTFTVQLGEMDGGRGVLFCYTQTHVPVQAALDCAQKWDTFLKKLASDFK